MLQEKADIYPLLYSGIKTLWGNPGENMTQTVKTVHNWGPIDAIIAAFASVNQSRVRAVSSAPQPITWLRPETGHPTHKPGKHGDAPRRVRRLEIRALLTDTAASSLAC